MEVDIIFESRYLLGGFPPLRGLGGGLLYHPFSQLDFLLWGRHSLSQIMVTLGILVFKLI